MAEVKAEPLCVKPFSSAGISCGIKGGGKKDLALIYCQRPVSTAAVFTTNSVKAPSILLSMERVRSGKIQAVVVNSGNANSCTGERGLEDTRRITRETADALGIADELVLMASTGSIGIPLPIDKICDSIPSLAESLREDGIGSAAEAIMTTDPSSKVRSLTEKVGKSQISIVGIAKGAGMISPNMATMLSFILTDAAIESSLLQNLFSTAVDASFNTITVDGQTSTSDMAVIMASGEPGENSIEINSDEAEQFSGLLLELMQKLAIDIVSNGEGATKWITVKVIGAPGGELAHEIARSIANSPLVKTSWHGEMVNWGRLMVAAGQVKGEVDPGKIDIYYDDILLVSKGNEVGAGVGRAESVARKDHFTVTVALNSGNAEAVVQGCDLSPAYVKINAWEKG